MFALSPGPGPGPGDYRAGISRLVGNSKKYNKLHYNETRTYIEFCLRESSLREKFLYCYLYVKILYVEFI